MELTPMMRQYQETKEQHPDEILFFRLGDFYEMFFDDAVLVSKELGLTLTSRSGDAEKSPMCGVPYHSAENYITKLIRKGYKVAIAEQIGDPKAPGLTKREVIKVVTPFPRENVFTACMKGRTGGSRRWTSFIDWRRRSFCLRDRFLFGRRSGILRPKGWRAARLLSFRRWNVRKR